MDAAQWPQGIGVSKIVEVPRSQTTTEKKPRPQKEQVVNCPRCNSTNTKFCYYNNYSLSQPRYFCKACRRYWTEGGTLRNVPVGGGSRKNNKRSISTSSSSFSKKPNIPDPSIPTFSSFPPQNSHEMNHGSSQHLNLAYPSISSNNYTSFSNFVSLQQNPNNMNFLKNGISSSKGLHTLMSMPTSDCNTIYSSPGIPLHDFKPTLNFSSDGFDNHQNIFGTTLTTGAQETSEKTYLPPLDELKQVSSTTPLEHNHRGQRVQDGDNGYWNGMYGGYSW